MFKASFVARVYSMQAMEKVVSRSRSLSYPKVTSLGQSGLWRVVIAKEKSDGDSPIVQPSRSNPETRNTNKKFLRKTFELQPIVEDW